MKAINNILIYGAVAMISLLGSCSKEPSTDGELPGEAIYINLSSEDEPRTRAQLQTDNEKLISSAFILFYGTVEGTNKDKLVKILDPDDSDVSTDGSKIVISASLIDTKQTYKIVVLANGGPTFSMSDITEGTDIQRLYDKVSQIGRQIPTPTERLSELLMSGTIDSHTFSQNPIAKVNLVRQAVKLVVNVTMNKTFTDNYPDAKFGMGADGVAAPKLSVLNVPTNSYLIRRATPVLPSKRYLDYLDLAMTASATEWTLTAYAYENPTKGSDDQAKSEATYFILQLPYRLDAASDVVTDNYYKFYINDLADPTNPHKTISNTLYNVSVAVNGFGGAVPDINGTQVKTTVLPWEGEVSQTDPVGEYVKAAVDAVTLNHEAASTINLSSSDMSKVTIRSTNSVINCSLNSGVITASLDINKIEGILNSATSSTAKPIKGIDHIEILYNGVVKDKIAVNLQVDFVSRFAKGYLTNDNKTVGGSQTPWIGNPQDVGLVFKWGSLCGFSIVTHYKYNNITPAIQQLYHYVPPGMNIRTESFINRAFVPDPINVETDLDGYHLPSIDNPITGHGDICRYALGFRWRIPTKKEIEKLFALGQSISSPRSGWPQDWYNNEHKSGVLNGYFYGKDENRVHASLDGVVVKNADPIKDKTIFMRASGERDDGGHIFKVFGVDYTQNIWTSSGSRTLADAIPNLGITAQDRGYKAHLVEGFRDEESGKEISVLKLYSPQYGFNVRCIRN